MTRSCFKGKEASLSNHLKPSISSSVNCGHVAANRSAGRAAEFHEYWLLPQKVETQPTRPMTTALPKWGVGTPMIVILPMFALVHGR